MNHKVTLDSHEVHISQRGNLFKVIKPWRKEDGSINWFNLLTGGSWRNLIVTTIIVIIVLGVLYEYSLNINRFLDCFRVPGLLDKCIETYGNVNKFNFTTDYYG